MKRKMFLYFSLTTIVGLLISFLIVVPLFQNIYTTEVENRLDAVIAVMKDDVQTAISSPKPYAQHISELLASEKQSVRITIIKKDGTVLADSYMDSSGKLFAPEYANHSNRPEIVSALKNGKGYSKRYSNTVKKVFYYTAVMIDKNTIFRAATPMGSLYSDNSLIWIIALISMVIGILFSLVIQRIISKKVVAPLIALTKAADDFASGKLDVRVGKYHDEMGKLANTFNIMAENTQNILQTLNKNQYQLEAVLQGMDDGVLAVDSKKKVIIYNDKAKEILKYSYIEFSKVLGGLPDIQRLEELLMAAATTGQPLTDTITLSTPKDMQIDIYAAPLKLNDDDFGALAVIRDVTRVKKLEQLRSQFVSNVTHELKTPLTSIKGFIELLKSNERDEETRNYFYEVMEIEAERLQSLIDDLLELSEIENGKDVNIVRCNLANILLEIVERLKPLANKKNITINFDLPERIAINANRHRLDQLFTNLLDNAIKYNKNDSEVNISAVVTKGIVTVKVADKGIGIEGKHFERIFERFYRVDKGRSRDMGGTGLGLSIVKHVVSLYGGDITVESKKDKGTTFTVRLPL